MIGKVMTEEKMKKLMGENGIIEEGFNQMIPIDMIKPCGFNTYAIEDVETLEREIRVAGLITPLIFNECHEILGRLEKYIGECEGLIEGVITSNDTMLVKTKQV